MLRRRNSTSSVEEQTINLEISSPRLDSHDQFSYRNFSSSGRDKRAFYNNGEANAVPSARLNHLTKRLNRQTTLALLTLDEERLRISRRQKRKSSDEVEDYQPPPPYSSVSYHNERRRNNNQKMNQDQHHENQARNQQQSDGELEQQRQADRTEEPPVNNSTTSNEVSRQDKPNNELEESLNQDCCYWPWFLKDRPVLRLFIVIAFNGLVSMMCAAIMIELESPEQEIRFAHKEGLKLKVDNVRRNLTYMLDTDVEFDRSLALKLLDQYSDLLVEYHGIEDEIKWEMLSASAFVTSVSSTTGYGDIVPVTTEGKIFTLVYSLYGIPIFIWYIVKLGALFRVLVMRAITGTRDFVRSRMRYNGEMRNQLRNVFITVSRPIEVQPNLNEELKDDKRFHPSVIGVILLIFMVSVAAFISYMEGITYFDAIYACFITYSTIGFGDIDIYRISYRSNWFNLMIYGNLVHVFGYTLLSAWISSILDKCGIRKF